MGVEPMNPCGTGFKSSRVGHFRTLAPYSIFVSTLKRIVTSAGKMRLPRIICIAVSILYPVSRWLPLNVQAG